MSKTIRLTCPEGHSRDVPADMSGSKAVCDECGHVWIVPEQGGSRANLSNSLVATGVHATPAEAEAEEGIECPSCAEIVKARAKVCRFCGQELDRKRPMTRGGRMARPGRGPSMHVHVRQMMPPPKSPGLAAVLAFFYDGLGHIYCGEIGTGFMLIFGQTGFVGGAYWLTFSMLQKGLYRSQAEQRATLENIGVIWVVVLIVSVIVHIGQIFSAYKTAERINNAALYGRRLR